MNEGSCEPIQRLFERALVLWSKPQMIRESRSWKGQPEARALCEILAERISESEPLLYSGLSHSNQHMVAYCLLSLDLGSSPRLCDLPEGLDSDKRHVSMIFGSFINQMQIGDLARKLRKKHSAHPQGPPATE
jgi:hypothetical protein